LEALKKLEHEYSLKNELDSAWAARPLAVTEHLGQTAIVLEDPGGKPLDRIFCLGSSVGSLVKDALERQAQDANDFDYDIGGCCRMVR